MSLEKALSRVSEEVERSGKSLSIGKDSITVGVPFGTDSMEVLTALGYTPKDDQNLRYEHASRPPVMLLNNGRTAVVKKTVRVGEGIVPHRYAHKAGEVAAAFIEYNK